MLPFLLECVLILIATSPLVGGMTFCTLAIHRAKAQKKRNFKIRATSYIARAAISFLFFPLVNLMVGFFSEEMVVWQMRQHIGASRDAFISIYGQPNVKYETTWYYFDISPWYSRKPLIYDENIVILIEKGKIVACILAD